MLDLISLTVVAAVVGYAVLGDKTPNRIWARIACGVVALYTLSRLLAR
jgi:hypothetical protein